MPDILNQNNLWISIISIVVFFFILIVAGLIQIVLQKLYKNVQTKNPSRILPQIIKLIKGPIVGLICLSAPFAAITIFNEISKTANNPIIDSQGRIFFRPWGTNKSTMNTPRATAAKANSGVSKYIFSVNAVIYTTKPAKPQPLHY